MGGCYSRDSESAAASPKGKLPGDRQPGHYEKEPQYSPLSNGDSQHQEDQILEQSIKPVSEDIVEPVVGSQLLHEDVAKGKGVAPSDSGIESIGPPIEESNCETKEKKEITLCKSCHNKLKRISRGSCNQCGQFRLDTLELSSLVNGDTYCTCGPRQAGKQPSCQTHGFRSKVSPSPKRHSDIPAKLLKSSLKKQGQERGDSKHVRMSWKSADSLDMNSFMNTCMDRAKSEASDVFGDDVSFQAPLAQFDSVDNQLHKENIGDEDGHAFVTSRMSIYSEILDLADSICHCDLSDAPLEDLSASSINAESCTSNLNESEFQNIPRSKARLQSLSRAAPSRLPVESSHLCSASWEEEDEDSGHGMSKSEGQLESSSDCEIEGAEDMEEHSMASCSLPLGNLENIHRDITTGHTKKTNCHAAAASVLAKLSSDCEEELCPVSVIVKGRQLVMMDMRMYSQLLKDLALLKKELHHLLQVIQGEEEVRVVQALNLVQE